MDVNWIQLIVNGFQSGAIYTLVALGLTLIFSIMYVVNFAHGEMYMLGGFAGYFIFYQFFINKLGLPLTLGYIICFIIVAIILGLFGFLLEKAIFRPFRGDLLGGLLISVGLGEILMMGAALCFGPETKGVPPAFAGKVSVLSASLSNQRLAVIFGGGLVMLGLYLFLVRTKAGLAMRAIAQDKEAAESLGINYGFTSSLGFAIGCALAGVAGLLVVPATYIDPFVGSGYLMKAFIIIIIGGMGSLTGCILGGFMVGFIESFSSFFINIQTGTIILFVLVIIFLVLRPRGLFGRAEV